MKEMDNQGGHGILHLGSIVVTPSIVCNTQWPCLILSGGKEDLIGAGRERGSGMKDMLNDTKSIWIICMDQVAGSHDIKSISSS